MREKQIAKKYQINYLYQQDRRVYVFTFKRKKFKNFLQIIKERANIDADIIEKDYYVCAVLKELSKKQNYLKAYFKGGTAVYKILENMNSLFN